MGLGGIFNFKKRRDRAKQVLEQKEIEERADFAAEQIAKKKANAAARQERVKLTVEKAREREKVKFNRPSFAAQFGGFLERATRPPPRAPVRRTKRRKKKRRAAPRAPAPPQLRFI